jgi:hypothetical protein
MSKIKRRIPSKKLEGEKLTALEMGRAKMEQMRADGIEIKQRNPREVWEDDKKSLRKSINAKCYDCCGTELHRSRIKFCNIVDCELWLVRPYSKGITSDQCLSYVEP